MQNVLYDPSKNKLGLIDFEYSKAPATVEEQIEFSKAYCDDVDRPLTFEDDFVRAATKINLALNEFCPRRDCEAKNYIAFLDVINALMERTQSSDQAIERLQKLTADHPDGNLSACNALA